MFPGPPIEQDGEAIPAAFQDGSKGPWGWPGRSSLAASPCVLGGILSFRGCRAGRPSELMFPNSREATHQSGVRPFYQEGPGPWHGHKRVATPANKPMASAVIEGMTAPVRLVP